MKTATGKTQSCAATIETKLIQNFHPQTTKEYFFVFFPSPLYLLYYLGQISILFFQKIVLMLPVSYLDFMSFEFQIFG